MVRGPIIALVMLAAFAAHARQAERVVLAVTDGSSTTSQRLEAELRSLGFEVIVSFRASAGESQAALAQMARNESALAAVRVVDNGTTAELWIADLVTDKTFFREIVIAADTRDGADDSIAVGVAELLRAILKEVDMRRAAPAERPRPPVVRRSTFWLALGARADFSLRQLQPSMLALGTLGWQSAGGFGFEALGAITVVPATVEQPLGRATISSMLLGAGSTFDWQPLGSLASFRAGLGMFASRVQVQGDDVVEPITAESNAMWAFGPYLHASPALAMTSFMKVRLELGALVALNAPRVLFADQPLATWGRPSLIVGIDLEMSGGR
jgi:hypothetical protein